MCNKATPINRLVSVYFFQVVPGIEAKVSPAHSSEIGASPVQGPLECLLFRPLLQVDDRAFTCRRLWLVPEQNGNKFGPQGYLLMVYEVLLTVKISKSV